MSFDSHHSSADSQPGDARDARWAAFGADDEDDTDEHDFWGEQAEWPTAAIPVTAADGVTAQGVGRPTDDATPGRRHGTGEASAGAITREHRRVEPDAQAPTIARPDVAGSTDDTPVAPVWDDRWAPADPARSGGVDPRLFRIGAVLVIITLLVPFVASFRSGGSDDLLTLATAESVARLDDAPEVIEDAASAAAVEGASSALVAELSDAATASNPSAAPTVDASADDAAVASGDTEVAASSDQDSNSSDPSTDDGAADGASDGGAESAVVVEQLCAIDYEVQGGDFWLRLADGAGVELAELLDANEATVNTPLYPGRSICLPAGSKTPPAPPASNAGSDAASGGSSGSSGSSSGGSQPTPTAAPKPAPTVPTTVPPTVPPTTAAPTTLPPPPPPAPAQVEQIIRNVWPDDLEEKALQIAWRESNYKANVRNYCCLGLFQIYWNVHQSWLGSMGITSSGQLFDAETNTRAAYALYQRSGGWGPWGG